MYRKFKRCVRYDEPGHAHALTFSCRHGAPLLENDEAKKALVDALNQARRKLEFDLWAYVIMPEHAHVVLHPCKPLYSISRILFAVKRPVSYRLGLAGRRGLDQFWEEGGGYDRNLRSLATIHKEINYLHNNPVRRGLCRRPQDWLYSSAAFWAGLTDVPLAMDRALPPQ